MSVKPPNPEPALLIENRRLRERVKGLERQVASYREMTREAWSDTMRAYRGEPTEGWIDPQPRAEPESEVKLLARLNQSKAIAHSRHEQLKRWGRRHTALVKLCREARQSEDLGAVLMAERISEIMRIS